MSNAKQFVDENVLSRQNRARKRRISRKKGDSLNYTFFVFCDAEKAFLRRCHETAYFDIFCVKILAVAKKEKK